MRNVPVIVIVSVLLCLFARRLRQTLQPTPDSQLVSFKAGGSSVGLWGG